MELSCFLIRNRFPCEAVEVQTLRNCAVDSWGYIFGAMVRTYIGWESPSPFSTATIFPQGNCRNRHRQRRRRPVSMRRVNQNSISRNKRGKPSKRSLGETPPPSSSSLAIIPPSSPSSSPISGTSLHLLLWWHNWLYWPRGRQPRPWYGAGTPSEN